MKRDDRGVGRKIKRIFPESLFRGVTVFYNKVLAFVPYHIKYPMAAFLRKNKAPYNVIEDGDLVVQVGCPTDLLHAGRSRGIHFARLVKIGRAVIIEADPENCEETRKFVKKYGLASNVTIVELGAYNKKTVLQFLSSPNHPAASMIEGIREVKEEFLRNKRYHKIEIHVDKIDSILKDAGLAGTVPKLVSLTTNGAELQILEGMERTIAAGLPYISLAQTGVGYIEAMSKLGYRNIAYDDRGFFFKKIHT